MLKKITTLTEKHRQYLIQFTISNSENKRTCISDYDNIGIKSIVITLLVS